MDWVNAGLVGADIATTEVILSRGGRELNPFMQNRGTRSAWAAARIVVAVQVPRELEKSGHKGWARGLRVAYLVIGGAIVTHNAIQLARGPR